MTLGRRSASTSCGTAPAVAAEAAADRALSTVLGCAVMVKSLPLT